MQKDTNKKQVKAAGIFGVDLTMKQLLDILWESRSLMSTTINLAEVEIKKAEPDIHKFDSALLKLYANISQYMDLRNKIDQDWFENEARYNSFKDRLGSIHYDMVQLKKLPIVDEESFRTLIADLKRLDSENYSAIVILQKLQKNPVKHKEPEKGLLPDSGPKTSWKDQIQNVALDLLKKNDIDHEGPDQDELDDNIIKTLAQQKVRLLAMDEPFGLVKAPVILGKSYITSFGRTMLDRPPMDLDMEFVHAGYMLIKNAWLLGFSERLISELQMDVMAIATHVHDQIIKLGNNSIKGMEMIGPAQKRGQHYYLLLMPQTLVERKDVNIYQWDFNPGVAPKINKNDLDVVTEDDIKKEIPSLDTYLPE